MARFTLLLSVVVGLVCLLDHTRALPLAFQAKDVANAPQIPNFPSPGEIPKPPGMLHSRITRDVPHEIPGQDQFPPPPPPPQMPSTRTRRNTREQIGAYETSQAEAREKREAKGTGKLPRKAG